MAFSVTLLTEDRIYSSETRLLMIYSQVSPLVVSMLTELLEKIALYSNTWENIEKKKKKMNYWFPHCKTS